MSTTLITGFYASPLRRFYYLETPIVTIDGIREPDPDAAPEQLDKTRPKQLRSIGEALGHAVLQNGYNESVQEISKRFDAELTEAASSGNKGLYKWLIESAFAAQGVKLLDKPPEQLDQPGFDRLVPEVLVPDEEVEIRRLTLVPAA